MLYFGISIAIALYRPNGIIKVMVLELYRFSQLLDFKQQKHMYNMNHYGFVTNHSIGAAESIVPDTKVLVML